MNRMRKLYILALVLKVVAFVVQAGTALHDLIGEARPRVPRHFPFTAAARYY